MRLRLRQLQYPGVFSFSEEAICDKIVTNGGLNQHGVSLLLRQMQLCRAFTLIEILVVVAIFGVLVALAMPVMNGIQNKGLDTKSLANLRQWGIGLTSYLVDSNNELPYEGAQENPSWAQLASPANEKAWFNVVPPYVGMKPLKDLSASEKQQLYTANNNSIFQCPRAKWMGNEGSASGPRFSYSFNSKLFGSGRTTIYVYQLTNQGGSNVNGRTIAPSTVPMILGARASLAEPKLKPGMNNDAGATYAYTRRASARTGGNVPMVMFDGSVRSFDPSEIMDNNGRNIPTSPIIWDPWEPDKP